MNDLSKSEISVVEEALRYIATTYFSHLKLLHATDAEKEIARMKLELVTEAQRKLGFPISVNLEKK